MTYGSAEGNCYYEWNYICRRALTFLTARKEVDADAIGVFGISNGGHLCWGLGATDDRVKTIVPIYGAGFIYDYRAAARDLRPVYLQNLPVDKRRYYNALAPEQYAAHVKCPVLLMTASNEQCNYDWSCITWNALPADTIRRISVGPSFVHHICYEQVDDLRLWMDAILKKAAPFPLTPRITVEKASDTTASILAAVDENRAIEYVKVFVAYKNRNANSRYWEEVPNKRVFLNGRICYQAIVGVTDTHDYLFAYASVKYKQGYLLYDSVRDWYRSSRSEA